MDTKQKNRQEQARKRSAQSRAGKESGSQRTQPRSTRNTQGAQPQTRRRTEQEQQPQMRRTAQAQQSRQSREAAQAQQPQQTSRAAQPQQAHRAAQTARAPQPIPRTPQETHNIVRQESYEPQQVQEQVFQTKQEKQRVLNPEAVKRAEQRRKSAQRVKRRKEEEAKRKKRPAVAYTQPVPVNLNQMLLKILVVFAVVVAITLGLSVFFKAEKVVVYGNRAYSAWTVQEAGGIEIGTNLLSLNNTRACGKIMTALPYVDNVRIGIKLPDTVNIYIEEIDIAYAITTSDGTYWLMTSEGKVVEQINAAAASSYTKIEGVNLDSPIPGQQAVALETILETTAATENTATEETAPAVVTAAAKLQAALTILQQLEANDIVGEAASIDVSILNNIELWYGQRFQVKLGDANHMDIKIAWMKSAVNQRSDYEMGILDVSFTTWPDRVGYTPFSE